jgi:hypothetical protein
MIGKNKCPYCQQMDYTLICLKITKINWNESIHNCPCSMDSIYINKKAKLLELAKRMALFGYNPPHRIILRYFNPIEDGKELTIDQIINGNHMTVLSPKLINYNDLRVEECNIKDGTLIFAKRID